MSEQLYEDSIAPLLAEVGKFCKEHGLPFLAVVEYAPGDFGQTTAQHPSQHMVMTMTNFAARARGNLDAFVLSVLTHCHKHGIDTSASIYARPWNHAAYQAAGTYYGNDCLKTIEGRCHE